MSFTVSARLTAALPLALIVLLSACGGGGSGGGEPAPPALSGISPGQVVRATPTVLKFSGTALPTSGLSVVPISDQFDICTAPTRSSATGFEATCDFQKLGDQSVEVRLNGQPIGQARVKVTSNVSNVTWRSPRTTEFGQAAVQPGEKVTFKVTGTQLLQGGRFTLFLSDPSVCASPLKEIGSATQISRQFECTLNSLLSHGPRFLLVQDNALGSGAIQMLWEEQVFQIGSSPRLATKLPASGVTASQCYKAGSNMLVACDSAEAIALSGSGKQDGMLTAVNAMSYSAVGSYNKDECIKDEVTGLIWEGKTTTGLRAARNVYTNFGDGRTGDASDYVATVNASGLCGYAGWRLPTIDEMHTLVDYSQLSMPLIKTVWFPDTIADGTSNYWTSSTRGGSSEYAYSFHFSTGNLGGGAPYWLRSERFRVRLVRVSQ